VSIANAYLRTLSAEGGNSPSARGHLDCNVVRMTVTSHTDSFRGPEFFVRADVFIKDNPFFLGSMTIAPGLSLSGWFNKGSVLNTVLLL
jgi:hypothetical protein